jgi:U3 small nucleolar RNA-associated protein 18
MEICAFSQTGEILAVAGRRGHIHLVDWNSGAGQVVGSFKMNANVKALCWVRGERGTGKELMSLGENAEVYIWDVGERRCVRRWRDDGEFGSVVMGGDPAGKYLAIG